MLEDKKLEVLCWNPEKEVLDDVPSYTADFETTTNIEDCRVWAWGVCEVESLSFEHGNDIECFIKWCSVHGGSRVYFHNLKFDGKFIIDYLLKNEWVWIDESADKRKNTFTTLISDMGQFYSIKLFFGSKNQIELLDSLKIIPLSVDKIPKAFNLSIKKLDIDYNLEREKGYTLSHEEVEYLKNDVLIVAQALKQMFDNGMKKMTAGSNSLADYQKGIGGKQRFRDWYPLPEYDSELRSGGCYKGGFTAVNPKYAGKVVGEGISFDVNSLYPSVMACVHGEVLPYGTPIQYEGKYTHDENYPLYIEFIEVDFTVKEGYIPTLQIKNVGRFEPTEYVTDSNGVVTLCLTCVDIELMYEHYVIHDIRHIGGYKFRGSQELFSDFVTKWTYTKTQATLTGNEGMRTIAKLQLNSLYGKFATNPIKRGKYPYLDDGVVKYRDLEPKDSDPIYLPVGAFVTSYARAFTIRAAQANYDRWLYSDTDSNYFIGHEPPKDMYVHDTELGAWKHETTFDRFKCLRAKTYCYEENNELTIHCAGMPYKCHKYVTMENFEFGNKFSGKLLPKAVKGGIVLEEAEYTLRK